MVNGFQLIAVEVENFSHPPFKNAFILYALCFIYIMFYYREHLIENPNSSKVGFHYIFCKDNGLSMRTASRDLH